jgi:hypothetical protein
MWCVVEFAEVGIANLENDPQVGWVHTIEGGPHTLLGSPVQRQNGKWVLVPIEIPSPPAIVADLS